MHGGAWGSSGASLPRVELSEGVTHYTDRDYALTGVPSALLGAHLWRCPCHAQPQSSDTLRLRVRCASRSAGGETGASSHAVAANRDENATSRPEGVPTVVYVMIALGVAGACVQGGGRDWRLRHRDREEGARSPQHRDGFILSDMCIGLSSSRPPHIRRVRRRRADAPPQLARGRLRAARDARRDAHRLVPRPPRVRRSAGAAIRFRTRDGGVCSSSLVVAVKPTIPFVCNAEVLV